MPARDEWLDLARKLDWTYSYVPEKELFPEAVGGRPWLSQEEWKDWDERYVKAQVLFQRHLAEIAKGERFCIRELHADCATALA